MASFNETDYTCFPATANEKLKKVPLPLPDEGYFFNDDGVKISVKTSSQRYATNLPGFVFLTDKRLVLIAKETKGSFDTFQILFADIMSLKAKLTLSPGVAAFVCCTLNGDTYQVDLHFADNARCQAFRDYLKMIVVTASAKNIMPAEGGLMEATRITYVELPPSYNDVTSGSDPILEENPAQLDHRGYDIASPDYETQAR
ncbi:hypothetical protein INT43_003504 [Umbelopsis isabellina]|uniref:Uncharacterized protein n=1 Tax=Mortierella isabellina TaxID=91625 RepID=A0A8H7UAD5_MORIS|nr:hypothetical protein INT43_003504 [Umbelopsis isabellina]